jgi:CheY-like chemotaxis protein
MGFFGRLKSLKAWIGNQFFLLLFNIEKFSEATIIYDSECRVLKYNRVAEKMFSHNLPVKGKTFCQVTKSTFKTCGVCVNKKSPKEKYLYHEVLKYNFHDQNVEYLKFTYFPIKNLTICYIKDYTVKQKEEERKRSEPIESMAKGIAHDFNNIFQIILGYLSVIENGHFSPENKEYLDEIKNTTIKGANLVKKVLFFSDVSSGSGMEYFNLSQEMNTVLKEISPIYLPAIAIEAKVEPNIFVVANKEQIKQLLVFIINYLKSVSFNGSGVVSLSLQKEKDHICSLKILKNGITEHDTAKIFDPYFSLDGKNLHGYVNGDYSGFDLAVSFKIIEKHQGSVNVIYGEHEIEIDIMLPTSKEVKRTKVMKEKKIALVDDEVSLLNLVQMSARSFGYRVDTFSSSEDFFNKIVKTPGEYSILFLDQNMPGMLGTEVLQKLREYGIENSAVLCSGYTEINPEEMEKLGIKSLLKKPFTIYQFVFEIKKLGE